MRKKIISITSALSLMMVPVAGAQEGDTESDSGFSYVDLYDPDSSEYVNPPSYPSVDYFTMYKPDVTEVKDAGISPPVYPQPTSDEENR